MPIKCSKKPVVCLYTMITSPVGISESGYFKAIETNLPSVPKPCFSLKIDYVR